MRPFTDTEIAKLVCWLDKLDNFIFLESVRINDENYKSLLFIDPVEWITCADQSETNHFLTKLDDLRDQGFHLGGWFTYEFGYLLEPSIAHLVDITSYTKTGTTRPLAVVGAFNSPFIFDHANNCQSTFSLEDLPVAEEKAHAISNLHTNISHHDYLHALDTIKSYIAAGDTYPVNFTLKLDFSFSGPKHSLYRHLRKNQSVSYGSWIRKDDLDIMSFSPELFVRSNKDSIRVRPMKGTMKRGKTKQEDAQYIDMLRRDLKNISENVMIVDLLRNDLGRLLHSTGGGDVVPRSLFTVETYETLLQMTSTIDGKPSIKEHVSLSDTIKALFPCGSVTGAPKIRTMEIIRELEKEPRGVYCGAIGYASSDQTVFNVPIRTLELSDSTGTMGIGSGIIHDSDPEAEWQECLLKSDFLTKTHPDFQLIETMLFQPGKGIFLKDYHLERLFESADYFLFCFSRKSVLEAIIEHENLLSKTSRPARIRLLLNKSGDLDISIMELDDDPDPQPAKPCVEVPLPTVLFSHQKTDPEDVFYYHKTTLRSLYDKERKTQSAKGHYEVLFTNTRDEVTEGSIANIFIKKDNRLFTPPVRVGLLPGTYRRFLLEKNLADEKILKINDLHQADALYISNSVRGLVQVSLAG